MIAPCIRISLQGGVESKVIKNENFESGGAVHAETESGHVLLVAKKGTQNWSLPYALQKKDEPRSKAAVRALRHTTGIQCDRLLHILGTYSAPPFDKDRILCHFMVYHLFTNERTKDNDEWKSKWVPKPEIADHLRNRAMKAFYKALHIQLQDLHSGSASTGILAACHPAQKTGVDAPAKARSDSRLVLAMS